MKPEDVASLVSKTIVVSLLGIGVNSIVNISKEIALLNINMVKLDSRVQVLSERQADINKLFQNRIERVESRQEKYFEGLQRK